jgi:asparagine synthase (glutamine-hydrolysing)
MDRVGAETPLKEDLGCARALVLPLEPGRGLPIIHGWVQTDGKSGEFSMLARDGEKVLASRDAAGTRPLYVGRSGKWIASDHRFFPHQEATLLPPASVYDFSARKTIKRQTRHRNFEGTFKDAGKKLAEILYDAIKDRVDGTNRVAVSFSGGLDSSLLVHCAKQHVKVIACSVYAPESLDSRNAPRAAEILGVELLQEEVTHRTAKRELVSLDLPFQPSLMDMSLWCIYSAASRLSSEAGARLILLGQLADELFGGYMKYSRALAEQGERAATRLMQEDMAECGERGLIRDEEACSRWLEPRFPFADGKVLEFGYGLPVGFKIRRGVKKAVLREAASYLGLPRELTEAPKKAAQYSSGVQRILE